jgi:hypothetical protein
MSHLFSPFTLRNLTLENRVVVSPMRQYICNGDGQMHDWHLMHLGQLAMGEQGWSSRKPPTFLRWDESFPAALVSGTIPKKPR